MEARNKQAVAPELFFRDLLESAPDAMVIVDSRGRIVIVNSQAERMFGYLRDELFGKPVEHLMPESIRGRHVRQRSGYVANPHVRPMGRDLELLGMRKDGSTFPVEISLSPVRTRQSSYVSSVIRDVTDRKEMERELIEARRVAERANKANTAFLAAASHDLRQPVQSLALINGALRRTIKDEAVLEMLDSQDQSLTTMTNLLNSLLDISRLDAGKVEPRISRFPLQNLLDQVAGEFSRQANQKGLDLIVNSTDLWTRSDSSLMFEILQNLVSNAIRYTEKGSVTIDCRQDDDDVVLSVADSGIGIDQEQLPKIFEEFHQVGEAGSSGEGFGLGLAIVRRLADLLEAKIDVTSVHGKGSEFVLRVPAVAAGQQAPQDVERADAPAAQGGSVLLIEDDPAVAKALQLLVEGEGVTTGLAATAEEALAFAHENDDIDVIVSDYHLRDGSTGLEAVAVVRARQQRELPAVILTGDTSVIGDEVKELGNCRLLRKPVNPEDLLKLISTAIETGKLPASIAQSDESA